MAGGTKSGRGAPLLTRRLAIPVGIFLASRLLTLVVAHFARLIRPQELIAVLWRWDGVHYMTIARDGYPASLPETGQSVHAFFPGFPLLIRGARAVTGLSIPTAGVAVNLVLATVAAALIWLLARDLCDEAVATRAVLLFSFFPGSYVLTMIYSEGAFLALAATCLLALHRRSWVVAGLAAAAGGATRPTGLVLTACCAWAAYTALRGSQGDKRALVAPALAPVGFLAWSAFLAGRTGSPFSWIESQEQGWGQGFDFGVHTARSIGGFLAHPLVNPNRGVCVVAILVVVASAVLLWRWRPPAILPIYCAGILFPALFSEVLTSTPRFALTAFPLHIAAARVLKDEIFAGVLAVSAALLGTLSLVALISPLVTP